ncbi:cubilin [Holotrichia oblita]|nr:cubilin [Holotrichia oblita]
MEYKFLKKKSATVRYGGGRSYVNTTEPTIDESSNKNTNDITIIDSSSDVSGGSTSNNNNKISSAQAGTPGEDPEFYLGDLITGTYCSRIFSDCDRKRCRLQSPNFPGVYPRNLTCYYAIRQHEVLPGRHALIIVRQPKGQLISIRSQSALYGTASTRELKVWNACDDVQDYVTVYDGYTTRDPVILKFCGGGEAVPEAISSGHELLVEFSTSPYGTFLHPAPMQSLHGFQLEVEVRTEVIKHFYFEYGER